MRKALIDSSTYFDLLRAPRHRTATWSRHTLTHTNAYLEVHERITLSALTIVEVVDGLVRQDRRGQVETFLNETAPRLDVIYPDQRVMALAGEINAVLALSGRGIGIVDCLIASTAIVFDTALVTANMRHFQRVSDAGYQLELLDWRSG